MDVEIDYQLRSMTSADLPEVLRIERGSYALPWSEKIFSDCLKTGYHTLVVETQNCLHGFILFSCAAGESHILNLCVDPQHRRSGIALVMVEQAIATVQMHGADVMFLEVRVSNTSAIALYEKLGFTETGRRENYYNSVSGDRPREDAILMAKALGI